MNPSDRADLVAAVARDTGSIYLDAESAVTIAGNGYQVQLPGCQYTGIKISDRAPVVLAPDVLVIHDGTNLRLTEDLITVREEQVREGVLTG